MPYDEKKRRISIKKSALYTKRGLASSQSKLRTHFCTNVNVAEQFKSLTMEYDLEHAERGSAWWRVIKPNKRLVLLQARWTPVMENDLQYCLGGNLLHNTTMSVTVLTISESRINPNKCLILPWLCKVVLKLRNLICGMRTCNRRAGTVFSLCRIVIFRSSESLEVFVHQALTDDNEFFFYCIAFILPLFTITKLFPTFPWLTKSILFQQIIT